MGTETIDVLLQPPTGGLIEFIGHAPRSHEPGLMEKSSSVVLKEVARHYLERAMDEAQGNKTKAMELVGLPSYQTLTNWLKTYEVQG